MAAEAAARIAGDAALDVLDGQNVKLTGNQTIQGIKNFVERPIKFFINGKYGQSFPIVDSNSAGMCIIDANTIAYCDAANRLLRTFEWVDDNRWAPHANTLFIAAIGAVKMAGLEDTGRIAFIDEVNKQLRTYEWNGTNWAQVGSGLTLTGSKFALASIDSTTIALIDESNKTLRAYTFNGSAWSATGTGLFIDNAEKPSIAYMSIDVIAYCDSFSCELRRYEFSGTDWQLIGSPYVLSSLIEFSALSYVSENYVAQIDEENQKLQCFFWDSGISEFKLMGAGLDVPSAGLYAMAPIGTDYIGTENQGRIAFIDSTNQEIRTYKLTEFV
jgi:hypothetical protein